MTAAVNLADTASLLTEVTNVFTPQDDMLLADKVVNTTAAIERQVQEKQAEIKQIVRGAWAAHT
jgi:hypothetical protein|eukprot:COSAG01_NODE_418_length_17279_cov_69.506228_2_plen_64_part_00